MEDKIEDLNSALAAAIEKAKNNQFTNAQEIQAIIECLNQGADPNYKTEDEETLVGLAIQYLNVDLLKCLIKHQADINQKNRFGYSYLKDTINRYQDDNKNKKNLEIIKELCEAGATLILNNCTVFHYLVTIHEPKEYIETIITHARFDTYDEAIDKELEKKIITTLCAFKRLNPEFPLEIQYRILSHVTLDYLFGFNKKLCKKIAYFDCKKYLEKRVENIEKILQVRDQSGGTAAKWWNNIATVIASQKDDQYKTRVTSLFDGTVLRKDMEDFQKSFPHNIKQIPADNLVLKMYENTQALLEK